MYNHIHNELSHKVWVLWHQTTDLIIKYEESEFKRNSDLTHQQYLILHAMVIIGTPVKLTDIAKRIERSLNTVSTILDRMEKHGLVKRVRDLPDRRSVRLEVTKLGMEKFVQTTELGWKLIDGLLSTFSDEDLFSLTHAINKLREKVFQKIYPGQNAQDLRSEDFHNTIHMFEKTQPET